MSLEKAIKSGQEYRKPYQGSKRFDRTCRNNGSCSYCAEGRQHKHKRRKLINEDYYWQTGQDPVFLRLVTCVLEKISMDSTRLYLNEPEFKANIPFCTDCTEVHNFAQNFFSENPPSLMHRLLWRLFLCAKYLHHLKPAGVEGKRGLGG